MTELNLNQDSNDNNSLYNITVKVTDVKSGQDFSQYTQSASSDQSGKEFKYDQEKVFAELKQKGYKILNPAVKIPNNISEEDQIINIFVDHDIKEINPSQPGNGLTNTDLQKNVSRIIIYQGANGNNPATVTDTLHFSGKGYFDEVTKKWTDASGNELEDQSNNLEWSHEDGITFNSVTTPFIEGYHVDSITSTDSKKYDDGKGNIIEISDVNQTFANIMITVSYAQNGSLIVVDKDGNQLSEIENMPTFPTNPANITELTAFNLPNIPGFYPAEGQVGELVQPKEDPSQDVTVTYLSGANEAADRKQTFAVNNDTGFLTIVFHDDITNKDINIDEAVGYKSGQQAIGTKVDYDEAADVEKLRKLGYEIAKVSVNIPTEIKEGYNVYTIHVKHHILHLVGKPGEKDPEYPSITPSENRMPLTKDIKRTIYFVSDQGQAINGAPDGTDKVVQTVHFSRTAVVDQVTGKVLGFDVSGDKHIDTKNGNQAWQFEEGTNNFPKVAAKYPGDIGFFRVSQKEVEPVDNILPTDKDVAVKIVYSQPISKGVSDTYSAMQTIKFVGENDNQLREPDIETKTGLIGNHTFKKIKVPVITGYVAEKSEAGGLVVNEEKTNVMQKIVYHRIGKILPVNPVGNPIPNVDRPNYINDPDDATKVLLDQDTPVLGDWSTNIPSISPEDPTVDTKVPYMNVSGGVDMQDIETRKEEEKEEKIEKQEEQDKEKEDSDEDDLFGLALAILGMSNTDSNNLKNDDK